MSRYAVIDFETTGLSPRQGDRAVEIGAVLVENGQIIDTYQSLINPNVQVSRFITDLTGISNEMIRDAPRPKQVFKEVHRFVRSATLVAHNASFDRNFWTHELSRLNLDAEHQFLCTMLISRRLYPWSPNHKLRTLAELHEIPAAGRHHRALADASVTSGLLLRILSDIGAIYPDESITPVFLSRYQKMRKVTAKAVPANSSTKKAAAGVEKVLQTPTKRKTKSAKNQQEPFSTRAPEPISTTARSSIEGKSSSPHLGKWIVWLAAIGFVLWISSS